MRTIIAVVGIFCTSISFGAQMPARSDESVIESNFYTLIQPNDLRDWMKLLAAQPNHVGWPHDRANAEKILAWLKG